MSMNPLRNAAHGDKRENRARNAVELRRFVEISREIFAYICYKNHIVDIYLNLEGLINRCHSIVFDKINDKNHSEFMKFKTNSEHVFDQLNDQKRMLFN
ncbi:hypothetical protein H8356DRAFT_1324740 [Neocallimastix lanati (nom. inval.)]|nr:hypothetical protein H8356DRAFT_1324740 [Neocallimastix sp. JGI-2020a]